jgi:hypothetical protein
MLPHFSYILFTLVSEKNTLSCTADHNRQTEKNNTHTKTIYRWSKREEKGRTKKEGHQRSSSMWNLRNFLE